MRDPVVQIAYFVNDARAAAERMAQCLGAGPFFLVQRIELAWAELRGQPGDFLHTSAYGQWGELMVEFVQQDQEGPSPFRDMYEPGEEGIHHMATMVDSLPDTYAHYAEQGLEVAAKAMTKTGTEFAFIDATGDLGHMIEVYEKSDALLGFYAMVRETSKGWDGSDVVRELVR